MVYETESERSVRTVRCKICGHIYGVMTGAGPVQCPWCRGEGLEKDFEGRLNRLGVTVAATMPGAEMGG